MPILSNVVMKSCEVVVGEWGVMQTYSEWCLMCRCKIGTSAPVVLDSVTVVTVFNSVP